MEELEALLLGAPLTLTPEQVRERTGTREELAESVWAALGFPKVPEGVVAFTERDVLALQDSVELLETGLVDADTWLVLARTMGQALARLSEAQLDVFRNVAPSMPQDEAAALALELGGEILPRLERTMVYVWRRQFAAAAQRALASGRDEAGLVTLAVGFVDIVDYTRTIRDWSAPQLTQALEAFERDVSLRVAAVGGRVVKTLGDGVLYTTRTALEAVGVALDTVTAHATSDQLPTVRAGVALGPVLERLGDVFGSPVNLASRLCDEARPSSVLVDKLAAAELHEATGLTVRPLERRSVRGFRGLHPFLVRREQAD